MNNATQYFTLNKYNAQIPSLLTLRCVGKVLIECIRLLKVRLKGRLQAKRISRTLVQVSTGDILDHRKQFIAEPMKNRIGKFTWRNPGIDCIMSSRETDSDGPSLGEKLVKEPTEKATLLADDYRHIRSK